MCEPVHLESAPPVATITLNRPGRRNALSGELLAELAAALERLADDAAVRCVLLTGAPPAFCAGLDLHEVAACVGDVFDLTPLARVYDAIGALPQPVIAVVDGPASAGGAGLASVCDVVLASARATFSYPGVRHGLAAPLLAAPLARRVGGAGAAALMLTGRTLSADEAYAWGLADELVLDGAALARAQELATGLAAAPAEVLAELKLELRADVPPAGPRALHLSDDSRARLAAFLRG